MKLDPVKLSLLWTILTLGFLLPGAKGQVVSTLKESLYSTSTAPQTGAQQGMKVAVDGAFTVAGSPSDDTRGADSGLVRVYDTATGQLLHVLQNPTPANSDNFGCAVAISGTRVVVGAYQNNTGAGNAGSAYVYDLAGATPTVPVVTLDNPAPNSGDFFGICVAISGTRVVVGAYEDDTVGFGAGSAYVYDLAGATPSVPVVTLNNPAPGVNDNFGYSVGISGSRVVVGANRDDAGGTDSGTVYLYDVAGANPTAPIRIFNDPSPAANEHFGELVGISGTRVLVGTNQYDVSAVDPGTIYVYDLAGSTPGTPVLTLRTPNPGSGDYFGLSAAISGSRLVVGAYGDASAGFYTGKAYVYDVAGANPTTPVLVLNNPTPAGGDMFGYAVAISGTEVAVGALNDDTVATDAGSAYVYDLAGASPGAPLATLNSPSVGASDLFGSSVAVSGTLVVVGAYSDDAAGTDAGMVYVHDLAGATPSQPIAALSKPGAAANDQFGISVAISGTRVVVGAPNDDTGATDSGSAYVYDLAGATPTVPVAILNNPSSSVSGRFGSSVAISGTRVVVGAPNGGSANAGSAYVYDLAGATPTAPIFTINKPSPAAGDSFGRSVAISGHRVVIGAPADDTGATNAGSAYVYDLSSATPTTPVATLQKPTPAASDLFGNAVAISGTRVVVGVPGDDTGATNSGSAFVYDLSGANPTVPAVTLVNPGVAVSDQFGLAVSISGPRVVVGTAGDDAAGLNAGCAYVFDLTGATPETPVATLLKPAPAAGDSFGLSVAVDVGTVVLGAPNDDTIAADKGAAFVFELSVSAPQIFSPNATLITANSATLNASVSAYGTESSVRFEYDDNPADGVPGTLTPVQTLAASASNAAVSAAISGLSGHKQYFFRVIATNSAGTNTTDFVSFTTLNTPPQAGADSFNPAGQSAPYVIPVSGNDSDADGDTLTYSIATQGSFGTAAPDVPGSGAIVYTPGTSFSGSDVFSYTVTDTQGATATATVTIQNATPVTTTLLIKGGAVPGAGEAGSGIPAGAVFKSFGAPSINGAGLVVFRASYAAPGGPTELSVFGYRPEELMSTVAARKGTQAPGLQSGVVFSSFKDPLLNARGDIAFLATLKGANVTPVDNQAIFVVSTDSDSDKVVARKGAQPPGVAVGAQFKKFSSIALSNEFRPGGAWAVAYVAAMVTGPDGTPGPGGVTLKDDTGLWLADNAGSFLAIREGQTLEVAGAAKKVKSFKALKTLPGAPGQGNGVTPAGVVAQVMFDDRTQALVEVRPNAAEIELGVDLTVIALPGDAVAGAGATAIKFGLATQDASGAVRTWISTLSGSVNNVAVVSAVESSGTSGLQLVARKGDAVAQAGAGVTLSGFSSVVVNHEEQYGILAKLAGTGVTRGNDIALLSRFGGQELEIVAREGDQPVGVAAGAQYAKFSSVAVDEGGFGTFYVAKLLIPKAGQPNPAEITTRNDTGLWAKSASGGASYLLVREGDLVGTKTVRSFTVLSVVPGSASQGRSLGSEKQVIYRAFFTDGTQALMKVQMP